MPPFPAPTALLCGALLALGANAQTQRDPLDPPAPLKARAAAAPAAPRSAATPPRTVDDPAPVDWRAANERVGRAGGWRSYARETAASEAAR